MGIFHGTKTETFSLETAIRLVAMELPEFTELLLPYPNKELKKACTEFGCAQSSVRADLIYNLWARTGDSVELANDVATFLSERQEVADELTFSQTEKRENTALEREKLRVESERLALETLKVQSSTNRSPDELAHELKMAELARQERLESLRMTSEAEIESKRLDLERANVEAAPVVNVPQANAHSINIKNYIAPYDGKADINLYLVQFERSCVMADIPERRWCLHLQALLTSELITVTAQLSESDSKDYQTVKAKLLERFQLTSDSARIKFRSVEKSNDQTFPDFAFMLRTHLNSWLKLSKVETFEELVDLVAMEHFISKCPPYVKYWLQDRGPQTKTEDTALLAEEHVICRKTNQAEASQANGSKSKPPNGRQAKNGEPNVGRLSLNQVKYSRMQCDL